ncbi:MAG: Gfo/Idh/MocA family oxidoreductase [Phycisphaerae bacterium]|nr:Gfo/Idh/MocA family oxidoreductase [Phycisphaerae bacterium]
MAKQTRRSFLKKSILAAGVFSIVPRYVLGGRGFTAPSEQLTKAVIGVGGMGQGHLGYGSSKLLAICDADKGHLANTHAKLGNSKDIKTYTDFRELLLRPDIDIVHIATPPHWHGLMSVAAAEAGKDIWCEKPMTRTIYEGKKVVEAVNKYGSIFRINTWFRFASKFYGSGYYVKDLKKLLESKALGWPLKVVVNASTGFGWKFYWSGKTTLPVMDIPKQLDYDLWLGPAPFKPYNSHRTHGTFRGYWDYDGGGLGDMGQHYLDPIQYILGKDDTSPVSVEVDSPQQHYDAVGPWRRVTLRYADGCEIILDGNESLAGEPFIEGPNGKVWRDYRSTIPNLRGFVNALPEPIEQVTDFEHAVKTRKKFALNESNGHRSCTLINLAKTALRVNRSLQYDPDKQIFINDDQANRFVKQPMRGPWRM